TEFNWCSRSHAGWACNSIPANRGVAAARCTYDRTPITRSTELAALRRGLPRWDTARGRRVHPEGRNTLFLVLMRDGFLVLLRDRLLVLARERRARQHEHGQIRER